MLAITTRSSPATSSIPRASLAPPVPPASTTTGALIARRKLASAGDGRDVRIREVGPRDGFQNEPEVIPTADKVRLIDALARTGLRRLEVTSFVRADVIPQLADAGEVLGRSTRPTASRSPS